MTRETIKSALLSGSPSAFVERHLFDCIPHVFQQDRSRYVAWKRDLATRIEVDPACITLVGSAAIGFSLNPDNNLRPFHDRSDIDVAIISSHHFNVAWRFLRNNNSVRARLDYKTKSAWDSHATNYVYWGAIATDKLLGVLPFGKQWLLATSSMAQVEPTRGRDINLRIYSDHESLRSYQTRSVKKATDLLLSESTR